MILNKSVNKIKISACLVVNNEEKLIERCLKSLKDVVDEIIIVHDGECRDNTLEIAKFFNAKIFTRPHAGAMEEHIPFCYEQAAGDWILRIDADEYLSDDLKNNLRILADQENIDAYEFVWPIWNGNKHITKSWPRKRCFFRKSKISFLGIIHFITAVKGRVEKSDLILEHRPDYNNFIWVVFRRKWLKWAKLQAKFYLRGFDEIKKFNYTETDWPTKIKLRVKMPILLMPLEFISTFSKDLISGGYKEGLMGMKAAFMYGIYRIMVNYYIFKYK